MLRIVFAVAFFRCQCECEFAFRLESFQFRLEFGEEHVLSVNIIERAGHFSCPVHYLSIYSELVSKLDYLFVFYLHVI